MKKNVRMFIIGIFVLFAIAFASADSYQLRCLTNGQSINFGVTCVSGMPVITAPRTGVAQTCVHNLDNGKICPANPGVCNSLGLSCTNTGSSGAANMSNPPSFSITSPLNNSVFNSKTILLGITADRVVSFSYRDINSSTNVWSGLCPKCSVFTNKRSFKEGLNMLQIRAVDANGKTSIKDLMFFIDSTKPNIQSTLPSSGFANGKFTVIYSEANLVKVNLTYGNTAKGFRNLDLSGCASGQKVNCTANVNLSDYNGQQITYSFGLLDKGGNKVSSRAVKLIVDSAPPKINSFSYNVSARKVKFDINITEANFAGVKYVDLNDRPFSKVLCFSLSKGMCSQALTFSNGDHNLIVTISDKAGNFVNKNVNFTINS